MPEALHPPPIGGRSLDEVIADWNDVMKFGRTHCGPECYIYELICITRVLYMFMCKVKHTRLRRVPIGQGSGMEARARDTAHTQRH